MIIDVNAYLGHYPFRKLPITSAARMVEQMETHGIDVSIVSSLPAVFYRDTQRGNEDLFQEVRPHATRLVPVTTINPKYTGWERDLTETVERDGARAVTLLPEHHGYNLTAEPARSVLKRIMKYEIPVILTQRLEDRRQRHHWDVAEDLTATTVMEIARQHPTLKFLLSNWIGLKATDLVAAGLRGRCLIDFARLHVLMNKDVPRIIEVMGVEAIAFGSHAPFDYLGPSLVKLANLAGMLPKADYEKIAWQNAAQFFRLDIVNGRLNPARGAK